MRNKKLWKNMMLATACTVALGTASVPVLAAEVNTETGLAVEAEPAPEVQTKPDAQVTTPDAQVEVDEQTSEVKAELTGVTFEGASNGVVTFTDADFDERGFAKLPVVVYGTSGVEFDVSTVQGSSDLGFCNPQDFEGTGAYTGDFYVAKADLEAAGGTKTYNGAFEIKSAFPTTVHDTLNYTITVKYVADENGNGGDNGNGGTETPDPDNGNGNGGTENPDGNNGSGDNNGNTETPDGNGDNNTETPDGNNGNNGNTETPDGNNGNGTGNEQNPITGQTVKPATKTESTSPKTGDMSAVLPVLGTGITSLGVALTALFRKRK